MANLATDHEPKSGDQAIVECCEGIRICVSGPLLMHGSQLLYVYIQ